MPDEEPDPRTSRRACVIMEDVDAVLGLGRAMSMFRMPRLGLGVLGVMCAAGTAMAQSVDSFGRSVPLGTAVQRIVPEGVSVRVEPSELESRRVSWGAGQDWRQVLQRAVSGAGLRMREVDGVVLIEAPPSVPATQEPRQRPSPPPSGAQGLPGEAPSQRAPGFVLSSGQVPEDQAAADSSRPPQGQGARGVRAESLPPPPPASPSRPPASAAAQPRSRQAVPGVWRVARGQTLDQVLADWTERAGWTLVFNTPIIYEIQAGAELRGDFIEAAASLINSIQARPLPRAVFYRGNRVLVISNSFEASTQ